MTEEWKEVGEGTTVTYGYVAADDQLGLVQAPTRNYVWDDFIVKCRYEADPHIYMLPIASPTGWTDGSGNVNTVAFIKTAAKTLVLVCDWSACTVGKKPPIPNPYPPEGSPWVLINESYEPGMIHTVPDGSSIRFRMSGTYVYGHRNPNELSVLDLAYPKPPWLAASSSYDRFIYPETFQDNLILDNSPRSEGLVW